MPGDYNVRVPSAQTDTSGISWASGLTPGRTIPLRDFVVAKPSDSMQTISNQLARGTNLLFTPGVYDVARSIDVKRADTVVLGLGDATLTAVEGAIPLRVADVPGAVIAGVTIDAGTAESPKLLEIGKKKRQEERQAARHQAPAVRVVQGGRLPPSTGRPAEDESPFMMGMRLPIDKPRAQASTYAPAESRERTMRYPHGRALRGGVWRCLPCWSLRSSF